MLAPPRSYHPLHKCKREFVGRCFVSGGFPRTCARQEAFRESHRITFELAGIACTCPPRRLNRWALIWCDDQFDVLLGKSFEELPNRWGDAQRRAQVERRGDDQEFQITSPTRLAPCAQFVAQIRPQTLERVQHDGRKECQRADNDKRHRKDQLSDQ